MPNNPETMSHLSFGPGSSQRRLGFTLIELLVTIAIIGVLSAISLTALGSAREKARDAKRKHDIALINSAMLLYFDEYHGYPDDGQVVFTTGAGGQPAGGWTAATIGNYLPILPDPPGAGDAEQNTYVFDSSPAHPERYVISVKLEKNPNPIYYYFNYQQRGGEQATVPTCDDGAGGCP